MRTYDFSPLWRSTIGFDRLFDLAEAAAEHADEDRYPPYNIERLGEDHYQISLALAGFSPDEISVTAEQNVVTVEGDKAEKADRDFMYQGISTRRFKRQFNLADYVQVKSAAFDNGLLKIELVREIPEAMKPRRIAVNAVIHPGTVFDHPRDVVSHPTLTLAEKRAILASWASDASAIASCPALRAPDGLKAPVTIDEILDALCELDGKPWNPPGGKPFRLRSTERA